MLWFILAVILLAGVFNPWTGLVGNTFYSPKRKNKIEPEKPKLNHKNFKMTKEG